MNLPPDQKVSFKLGLMPRMPNRTELGYAELMGGVPQANTLIHDQAGMLAMFVPKMKGVVLRYQQLRNCDSAKPPATPGRKWPGLPFRARRRPHHSDPNLTSPAFESPPQSTPAPSVR